MKAARKDGLDPFPRTENQQQITITFKNDSALRIRVIMRRESPVRPGPIKRAAAESHRIRAFGEATFASALTKEVLTFEVLANNRQKGRKSFGPLYTDEERRVIWDGNKLEMETSPRYGDRSPQQKE